jgi:hypothetical protein
MGGLADTARWVEDAPQTNVRDLAHVLDEEAVRAVLLRTLGRDEGSDDDDDDEGAP